MPDNSLLHALNEVHFGAYSPEDVEGALDHAEAAVWDRVAAVTNVAPGQRTFQNTAQALDDATEELNKVCKLVEHLASVVGGTWHEANETASQRQAAVRSQLQFDRSVYQALVDLRAAPEKAAAMTAPELKYLDEVLLNYERNGIALPGEQQEELKKILTALSAAQVAFSRNVVEASDVAGLAVTDEPQLAGLSKEFAQQCREAAEAKGLAGWWLTYNFPNYHYVQANCSVRQTRQDFYRVHVSVASERNLPVAQEVLELRRRMSRLLGYQDYADYALELRMAKNGATAAGFVTDLLARYGPAAAVEHSELLAFAREVEADPAFELDASEIGTDTYHANLLRAHQVGLDQESLRDYFSLPHARDVMFETLGALYGLELRPVDEPKWHADVEVYQIWSGSDHLCTVWCDWYARPGKGAGAWADVFYVAPRAGGRVDQPTLSTVVCNFPPPEVGSESRLTLRDVETMWHEFGHNTHITCNMTELRQHASFSCRWDFIEAPSQIMENWVWRPEVLDKLACHRITVQGLDDHTQAQLLASRRFRVATATMRQLAYSNEDLALHRDYQGTTAQDLLAYHRQLAQPLMPVPMYPEDAFIASFKHVFGGDAYAAAYYSYKWADVIQADFFSAFLPDKVLSREVGMRYRSEVLARGAQAEPEELVQKFMGRPARADSMLARDGISL